MRRMQPLVQLPVARSAATVPGKFPAARCHVVVKPSKLVHPRRGAARPIATRELRTPLRRTRRSSPKAFSGYVDLELGVDEDAEVAAWFTQDALAGLRFRELMQGGASRSGRFPWRFHAGSSPSRCSHDELSREQRTGGKLDGDAPEVGSESPPRRAAHSAAAWTNAARVRPAATPALETSVRSWLGQWPFGRSPPAHSRPDSVAPMSRTMWHRLDADSRRERRADPRSGSPQHSTCCPTGARSGGTRPLSLAGRFLAGPPPARSRCRPSTPPACRGDGAQMLAQSIDIPDVRSSERCERAVYQEAPPSTSPARTRRGAQSGGGP